jgi:hypothetical protein
LPFCKAKPAQQALACGTTLYQNGIYYSRIADSVKRVLFSAAIRRFLRSKGLVLQ